MQNIRKQARLKDNYSKELVYRVRDAALNDGTWEATDNGKISPLKLAVAHVLWPQHVALADAGITDDASARRILGPKLFTAAQALRIDQLANSLDDEAQIVEANPSAMLKLSRPRQKVLHEIINGDETPTKHKENDSEWTKAIEIAKHRWRQLSRFEIYQFTPDQRRRIRIVFEHVDGVGSDIVAAERKKVSVNANALAKKLRAAEYALGAAGPDLADVARRGTGLRRAELASVLSKAAAALESEADLQDRLKEFHGHVETRGGKNIQRSQVIALLVPIYEEITGKKAHTSWNPNVESNNRETLFVRFVSDMCKKAGHDDWCPGLVDAVRTTLRRIKQGSRGKKPKV